LGRSIGEIISKKKIKEFKKTSGGGKARGKEMGVLNQAQEEAVVAHKGGERNWASKQEKKPQKNLLLIGKKKREGRENHSNMKTTTIPKENARTDEGMRFQQNSIVND